MQQSEILHRIPWIALAIALISTSAASAGVRQTSVSRIVCEGQDYDETNKLETVVETIDLSQFWTETRPGQPDRVYQIQPGGVPTEGSDDIHIVAYYNCSKSKTCDDRGRPSPNTSITLTARVKFSNYDMTKNTFRPSIIRQLYTSSRTDENARIDAKCHFDLTAE